MSKELRINYTETVEETHWYNYSLTEDDLSEIKDLLIKYGFEESLVNTLTLEEIEKILQDSDEDKRFDVSKEYTSSYTSWSGNISTYTREVNARDEIKDWIMDSIYSEGWDDSQTDAVVNAEFDCSIEGEV